MNLKRVLPAAMGCALLLSPALLVARQDQSQESVVDASRKAQAAKKTGPKAKIVIDNDNLDTLKGIINVVGEEPVPPEDVTKVAAAADKTKIAAPGDVKGLPFRTKLTGGSNLPM